MQPASLPKNIYLYKESRDITFKKKESRYRLFYLHKIYYLYYYLRGFSCLDSSFFSSKMPLHLYVYVETKLKDIPVKM